MPEHSPYVREALSPFAQHELAFRSPIFWDHAVMADVRHVMVRLEREDTAGLRAYVASLRQCGETSAANNQTSDADMLDLDRVHYASVDDDATAIDVWVNCRLYDLPQYRHAVLDAKDLLIQQETAKRRSKIMALAALVGVIALPAAITVGIQNHGVESDTGSKSPAVTSKQHQQTQNTLKNHRKPTTPKVHESTPAQPPIALSASPTPEQVPSTPATPVPTTAPTPVPTPAVINTPFRIATFNALGASHTDSPRGKAYGELPHSRKRTQLAAKFIAEQDVVGLQEFQRPQRSTLMGLIGDQYNIFPTTPNYHQHASENSIIWNAQRFTLMDSGFRNIHYFNGNNAKMPWVLLQDKITGKSQYILNTHDPADTRQFPNQAKWRKKDQRIHLADAHKFSKSGVSTFLVGDFNSSACMLRTSGIVAEAMDIVRDRNACSTGRGGRIDHILVSNNVSVSNVELIKTKNMTDHPIVEVAVVASAPLA